MNHPLTSLNVHTLPMYIHFILNKRSLMRRDAHGLTQMTRIRLLFTMGEVGAVTNINVQGTHGDQQPDPN